EPGETAAKPPQDGAVRTRHEPASTGNGFQSGFQSTAFGRGGQPDGGSGFHTFFISSGWGRTSSLRYVVIRKNRFLICGPPEEPAALVVDSPGDNKGGLGPPKPFQEPGLAWYTEPGTIGHPAHLGATMNDVQLQALLKALEQDGVRKRRKTVTVANGQELGTV